MLYIPVIAAAAAGTLLYGQCNCCSLKVGGVDFHDQCWLDNPLCLSRDKLCHEQCMTSKGKKCWKTKPELAAASFVNNGFVDPEYQDVPVSVSDVKICCDKAYVVLCFPNCGKMAFELSQPVKKGSDGIWVVNKYAYV